MAQHEDLYDDAELIREAEPSIPPPPKNKPIDDWGFTLNAERLYEIYNFRTSGLMGNIEPWITHHDREHRPYFHWPIYGAEHSPRIQTTYDIKYVTDHLKKRKELQKKQWISGKISPAPRSGKSHKSKRRKTKRRRRDGKKSRRHRRR